MEQTGKQIVAIGLSLLVTTSALGAAGGVKWSVSGLTTIAIQSSPALGTYGVYLGIATSATQGYLKAYNAATGALLWSRAVTGAVYGSPVVNRAGTRIYLCTDNNGTSGYAYCFDNNGTQKWSYQLAGPSRCTPALSYDESYLYVTAATDSYNWLYALYYIDYPGGPGLGWTRSMDAGTPDPLFGEYEMVWPSPSLGADGTVYAIGGPSIYAFSANGQLKTYSTAGGDNIMSSIAIGPDGSLFVGDPEGAPHVIDPITLVDKPITLTVVSEAPGTPVVAADGTVYVPCEDGKLYAFKMDGTLKWSFPALAPITSSPALAADGHIWVVAWDGYLYGLDSGGNLITQTPVGNAWPNPIPTDSSPTIGPDGTVYVACQDAFYSVEGFGPGAALAPGSWSCFGGRARHGAEMRINRWTEANAIGNVTVVPIGPFSSGNQSLAFGINDAGQVTGYANGRVYPNNFSSTSAFRYPPLTGIGFPQRPYGATYGLAIASSGRVVGYESLYGYRGLVCDPITGSSTLSALSGFTGCYAFAISADANRIVGYSTALGSPDRATRWGGAGVGDFGSLSAGGASYAYGVNTSEWDGRIVGKSQALVNGNYVYHAFKSDYDGSILGSDDLGSAAGASGESSATAINGFNQIVGKTQTTSGVKRPFLKNDATGSWNIPSMPANLDGTDGSAAAINECGQIVGWALDSSGNTRAFIWTPCNPQFYIKNLNDFLTTSQKSQWTLQAATSINDRGWVVGYGLYNGATTGFLLYPN
jgi:probable HAF family extracellular repeat protein